MIKADVINEQVNICGALQYSRSACKANDHCKCSEKAYKVFFLKALQKWFGSFKSE